MLSAHKQPEEAQQKIVAEVEEHRQLEGPRSAEHLQVPLQEAAPQTAVTDLQTAVADLRQGAVAALGSQPAAPTCRQDSSQEYVSRQVLNHNAQGLFLAK